MRSESEMFELILNTAREDERIRAVVMNGSRANSNAPRDMFQDFDIVYFVTEVASFVRDPQWLERFGERMVMQIPDDPPGKDGGSHAYLMQFRDGNRIDLTLFPVENLERLEPDSLSTLLLDKDGVLKPFPAPSDRDYLPKPPNAKQFFDCCNEFWWVCPYLAKGLWRNELTYVKHHEFIVREQLLTMLIWYAGMRTGFLKSLGKHGKYLQQYLEPETWQMLLKTYPDADFENIWAALFAMADLFRMTARSVAEHFGFDYPDADDRRVTAHLRHVKALPEDAAEIY
jgi:aminoglycoside 6-adenylyltransferase